MKKVKTTELNESNYLSVRVKEGKIKKKKLKNINKLKDAAGETGLNLVTKKQISDTKSNNNNVCKTEKKIINISAKLEENTKFMGSVKKIANDKSKTAKKIKWKKYKQSSPHTETPSKELTEADLKRIEKKKAKKLAQKLRNKQRKQTNKTENNDTNETPDAHANGGKKIEQLDTAATKNLDATSIKVLGKKERKAENRRLIKDQKVDGKRTWDPALEASTVFVGNLPVNTKRVQLKLLFKDFAPVNFIRLRTAGGTPLYKHKQRKAAGSLNAYIVLKNKETAEKALYLNGVEFKGHHLRVTLAAKQPQGHKKEEAKKTVFVGNLKYSATEESLRGIFSSCGEVDYVRCVRDGDKGCKGVAYVCFKTADAVGLALELNGTIVDERPINVERYSVKKLGAKEARDALAVKEDKSKTGAKQRIDSKKVKKEKPGYKNNFGTVFDVKKSKKSGFRGVKVEEGLQKKQKSKKKKTNDRKLQLAKKIAPKIKTD